MAEPTATVGLLFDHMIAQAERTLTAARSRTPHPSNACRALDTLVADMYERRQIALEEMMKLPFRSAQPGP